MNTERRDGTSETARKTGLWRRLRLRRHDGAVYLDRWGIGHDRIGRVLIHRMQAPDPGTDLHDHPWWFCSIVLWGGYVEQRAQIRRAVSYFGGTGQRRGPLSVRTMRLDECHTVSSLLRRTSWSLVIGGPRRRIWGFYVPGKGWVDEKTYDDTIRAERRDMWNEVGT